MSTRLRFVHVAFGFSAGEPSVADLEKVFNTALDWIRYDIHGWILYTSTELDIWRDRIHNSPLIKPQDTFFLCEFEKGKYSGYQTQTVWEFLNKPR
jgi:hypothetical protein